VGGKLHFELWTATERDQRRLDDWVRLAGEAHENFVFTSNSTISESELKKAVDEARVALVTTAGVHLREDEPFDTKSHHGDPSFRAIPPDASHPDLMVSDTHFNSEGAENDINCLFPIERLRKLADRGQVGALATSYYGFMGFNPDPDPHLLQSADEVAELLADDDVDLVVMSPG
jgi:D-proline reductase (dithiol) PrdB